MKKETEKAKSLEDQVSLLERDLQAELSDFLDPRKIMYDLYLDQGISDVDTKHKIFLMNKLLNKKIDDAAPL